MHKSHRRSIGNCIDCVGFSEKECREIFRGKNSTTENLAHTERGEIFTRSHSIQFDSSCFHSIPLYPRFILFVSISVYPRYSSPFQSIRFAFDSLLSRFILFVSISVYPILSQSIPFYSRRIRFEFNLFQSISVYSCSFDSSHFRCL